MGYANITRKYWADVKYFTENDSKMTQAHIQTQKQVLSTSTWAPVSQLHWWSWLVANIQSGGGDVRYNIYNDGGGDMIYIMTVEISYI